MRGKNEAQRKNGLMPALLRMNRAPRIDPENGEVVGDPITVGAQPASIAVGPDSVWTADFGASTVTELRP